MIQRNISMPHPVLGVGDDFTEGAFTTNFKIAPNRRAHTYDFYEITKGATNPYIRDLLRSNKLDFILKISCTPTYKSWIFVNKDRFSIPDSQLHSLLEVESFLVANQELPNYNHATFNQVFRQINFQLEKGDIVALTGLQRILLPKQNEQATLGSIFKFSKIPDASKHQELHFSFEDDQITVYYPASHEDIDPVHFLFDKTQGAPYTALNIYILPALTQAFLIMADAPDEYADKRWYYVLDTILPESKRTDDTFMNAQRVIRNGLPVNLAVSELMKLKIAK